MNERNSTAYDRCPRCKGGQIEARGRMYGEDRYAVEHLVCNDCGLEFEQIYKYVKTVGE